MARIRTVKPEYWTDDSIGQCSIPARLLFIASWNFADDHGGLARSAKQLKAQAFPYDNIDCEPLIQELLQAGRLIEYEVGGKKYLHIKGFRTHQKVEKPALPRIPVYQNSGSASTSSPTPSEGSLVSSGSSPTSNGLFSGREGKGKEGIKNPSASSPPANGTKVSRETDFNEPWLLDFKLAYPRRSGDQGWVKAKRAANARIAEGHGTEEFIAGAKRYAAFCEATGKVGTEYVKQACTFLGPDKPFLNDWGPPPTKAEARQNKNISASQQWLAEQEANDAAH